MKKLLVVMKMINKGCPSGPPGLPGPTGIWFDNYCPICGNNNFHDKKYGSITATAVYGYNPVDLFIEYHCFKCEWRGTLDNLLTKQEFLLKQRKEKLLKLNENED